MRERLMNGRGRKRKMKRRQIKTERHVDETSFLSREGKFDNLRSQRHKSLRGIEMTGGRTEEWRQKWVRECESTRGSCKTGE